jgi:hypothetical protein
VIRVVCRRCHDELVEHGALVFGTPYQGECAKSHLCVNCYSALLHWFDKDDAKARWRERAPQEAAAMERVLAGDEGVPAPPTSDDNEEEL